MKKQHAFTLIELMIVIVVLGIVSTIAVNTYRSHVIESNRTEARSALQLAAATLEKCRSVFGRYDHADCGYADFSTESNVYRVTANVAATAFTLTATPVAGSVQTGDTDCAALTLTSIGIKDATGNEIDRCW